MAQKTKTTSKSTLAAVAKQQAETEETGEASVSNELKKRELLQLVAERSGLSRNKVKPVVEAMMEVLGEAIAEGREMNLEPLGKLMRKRTKETGNAVITIAKIRQRKAGAGGGGAEAEAEETV